MLHKLFKIKITATLAIIVLALIIVISGCGSKKSEDVFNQAEDVQTHSAAINDETVAPSKTVLPTETPEAETPSPSTPEPTPAPIDYSVVKPYEVGQIMIIMYHSVVDDPDPTDPYQRSTADFKNDLQTLYDMGFRLIPLKNVIANNITTAASYTPVAITFDDGNKTAFSLVEQDGKLVPTPGCALDIMQKFAEVHPDFGCYATFYINTYIEQFAGSGTLAERLNYLVNNGCDIGNHTVDHKDMADMTADEIQWELAGVDSVIRELVPGYTPVGVCYPNGSRPDASLYKYILDGESDGHTYHYDFALREGDSGAPAAVNRVNYDPLNIPRVRGSNDEITDLGWKLDFYKENPEYRYVSDGDPQTIVIPQIYAQNVDESSLDGKTLIYY